MRIAFLGIGAMGRAIALRLTERNDAPVALMAHDVNARALRNLPESITAIEPSRWQTPEYLPDAVVIAVKPSDVGAALAPFTAAPPEKFHPLWISIVAGVSLDALAGYLGPHARICRCMPNTPALIGESMTVYAVNDCCGEKDIGIVEYIFSRCGMVLAAPEKMLHAVTGLSGSGPAYVFLFIEALIEGGVTAGLPYDTARACAIQTVLGASRLLQQTPDESPSTMKARVMSPGGTTVRGLMALEQHGFKYAVIKAVCDAAARSGELGAR
jgi:pyrroline-5-carboxylate reductase